jgi:hypothetical protein
MGQSVYRIPNDHAICGLSVQKIIYLFGRLRNNCIFPPNACPVCISAARLETCYYKGFHKIDNLCFIHSKIVNPAKSLPRADSVSLKSCALLHIFFCKNQNPSKFATVTKTL